jgi:hypothetical protein
MSAFGGGGAQVLGPIGATLGGAIGGTIDLFEPPPPPVVTYVEREDVPSVRIEKDFVVGEPLPQTVVIHQVPHYPKYAYAVVNNERPNSSKARTPAPSTIHRRKLASPSPRHC